MAFVGYKSLEQATWIKDVWEGVWLDGRSGGGTGSRISVEWAKNAQFEEFMTLSNPRKNKSLVNEIVEVSVPATPHQPTNLPVPQERVAVPNNDDDDDSRIIIGSISSPPPIYRQEPDLQEVNLPEPASKEWDQEDEQPTKIAEQLKPDEPVVPKDEATILESGRLFLRNLAFSVTEEELREIFEPYGNLTQVHILLDQARPTDFQGRLLHILPAVTRNSRPDHPVGQVHNTVKFDQDTKRKLESSKQFNWASLYMNSDAVASSIADRLKISKSDLYDPEASNPAIKLAPENRTINDDNPSEKHPYNTSTNVIKALFSEHGSVIKVLMPPSGTIAIVEMADKEDAKSAFRSLSYKRIGNSVLYLEKAPLDLWKIKPTTVVAAGEGEVTTNPEKSLSKEDAEGEAGSTLFVKNLSFGTTPESLASKPKNPAIDSNNCYLDGHSLQLNFAKRGKESTHDEDREDSNTTTIKDKKTSNKLLIKNLPFEINKKELHELFGVYGKLKSIRIPKKSIRNPEDLDLLNIILKKKLQKLSNL
ncbi:hypothetical protein H4Q26_016687 [Puccinia striiformis f. sp. tritici PST-130]|nr:hypothetical protein H4Q26_016687 [Puccinia striiformis f. sp. tritici PST-130]